MKDTISSQPLCLKNLFHIKVVLKWMSLKNVLPENQIFSVKMVAIYTFVL